MKLTPWALVSLAFAAGLIAVLVCAVQWTAAFDGFDSDLWTYVLIMERVAAGDSVLEREPLLMQPPASPQVSGLWIALGFVQRWLGIPSLVLVRLLALVSAALLSWGAWALGRSVLSSTGLAALSVLLFWLSLPETWAALALGRTLCLGFVLLTAAEALGGREGQPRPLWLGLFVGLGFYVHLFGGILAALAAALGFAARGIRVSWPGLRRMGLAALVAAIVSAPPLAHVFATAGLVRTSAHTWRPGQLTVLGMSFLEPGELLAQIPVSLLLLTIAGLVVPAAAHRRAQTFGRLGLLCVVLVFFTPLYGLAAKLFGAWLVPRFAVLAFPWLGATLALAFLVSLRDRPWRSLGPLAAIGLVAWVAAKPVDRAVRELAGRTADFRFGAEAQAEAFALRLHLKDRQLLSADLMGYALAGPTLGQPLSVPPGHASPFGDFVRQQRRVNRALATNTPECWTALFSLYPDARLLVTPAAGALDERALWAARTPTSPEAVREQLSAMGALQPVLAGRFFVIDALRPPAAAESVERMGRGSLCRQ
jgi:hypothetical protein